MGRNFQGARGVIPDTDARRATSTDPRRPLTSRNVHVKWYQKARCSYVLDVPEGIRNANERSIPVMNQEGYLLIGSSCAYFTIL